MRKTKDTMARTPEELMAEHGIDLGRELTTGFAARYIRRVARRLARRPGFSKADMDDLSQHLCLKLIENLEGFDPERATFDAYVTTVVSSHAANVVRDLRAAKRNGGRVRSLNMQIEDRECGEVELWHTIDTDGRKRMLCVETQPMEEAVDLRLDVDSILHSLPADLRELAERLRGRSVAEVARDLGVSRQTVYTRLKRLRKQFSEAGGDELRGNRPGASR